MRLHDLRPTSGARRARKRVGRGQGSGHGKTSCRGHKGQKSRSGGKVGPGFEGGQMPLQRRLPKRGFRSPFKKEYSLVHLGDLQRFEPGSVVDPEALRKAGLVRRGDFPVKVLSDGELMHPITLRVQKVTERARQKIVAVGGFVEEILR